MAVLGIDRYSLWVLGDRLGKAGPSAGNCYVVAPSFVTFRQAKNPYTSDLEHLVRGSLVEVSVQVSTSDFSSA